MPSFIHALRPALTDGVARLTMRTQPNRSVGGPSHAFAATESVYVDAGPAETCAGDEGAGSGVSAMAFDCPGPRE
jgi:hypothetical protein